MRTGKYNPIFEDHTALKVHADEARVEQVVVTLSIMS